MTHAERIAGLTDRQLIMSDVSTLLKAWSAFTPVFAQFVTTTENADPFSDAGVTSGITGYYDQLLTIGDTQTTTAALYSRLRPVTDLSVLSEYNSVFVSRLFWRPFDTTLTGEPDQDAQVLTEIEASLGSDNDAYMQARFTNAAIGGWQPNFFRPSFRAGGKELFRGLNMSNFGTNRNNAGDLSMGFTLPYEYTPPVPYHFGRIQNAASEIQVRGTAAQLVYDTVAATWKLQQYPLILEVEFLATNELF